jgi:hypothetical protein
LSILDFDIEEKEEGSGGAPSPQSPLSAPSSAPHTRSVTEQTAPWKWLDKMM